MSVLSRITASMNGLKAVTKKAILDPALSQWLNKIHCGNCVELMDKMPADSVDLIVTSPPYNLRNSTGNGMKNGSGGKWENARAKKLLSNQFN